MTVRQLRVFLLFIPFFAVIGFMALKFRLKGLAETFVDNLHCSCCGHDGGTEGDQGFSTELTRVTFDGIIVVIHCHVCDNIFIPEAQRLGILDSEELRKAVKKDCRETGEPLFTNLEAVRLDVEKLNAIRVTPLH
jgi:hypothetical protein